MLAYNKSHIGLVRKTNEDSFVFEPPHLFVVADGMGGHIAGEIASKIAVNTVSEYLKEQLITTDPQEILQEAVCQANDRIYNMSGTKPECAGMGTTVSAVYIKGEKIYWSHVGDSRIYLYHAQQLAQLTNDHSLVGELYRSGKLTKEEALNHPNKNILTRAVGTDTVLKVDCGFTTWEAGDALLLCTDGLTNMVSDEEIQYQLQNLATSSKDILDNLVEKAIAAGGFDNITAILVVNGDAIV